MRKESIIGVQKIPNYAYAMNLQKEVNYKYSEILLDLTF